MGYSDQEHMVRVDFFKPSGKWYATEAVPFRGWEDELYRAFAKSLHEYLLKSGRHRLGDMTAVCLEPYHKMGFPLMAPTVDLFIAYWYPESAKDLETSDRD